MEERKRLLRLSFTRALADSCQLFSPHCDLKTHKGQRFTSRKLAVLQHTPCRILQSPAFLASCFYQNLSPRTPGDKHISAVCTSQTSPEKCNFSVIGLNLHFSVADQNPSPSLLLLPQQNWTSSGQTYQPLNRKQDGVAPREPATSRQCCFEVCQPQP